MINVESVRSYVAAGSVRRYGGSSGPNGSLDGWRRPPILGAMKSTSGRSTKAVVSEPMYPARHTTREGVGQRQCRAAARRGSARCGSEERRSPRPCARLLERAKWGGRSLSFASHCRTSSRTPCVAPTFGRDSHSRRRRRLRSRCRRHCTLDRAPCSGGVDWIRRWPRARPSSASAGARPAHAATRSLRHFVGAAKAHDLVVAHHATSVCVRPVEAGRSQPPSAPHQWA